MVLAHSSSHDSACTLSSQQRVVLTQTYMKSVKLLWETFTPKLYKNAEIRVLLTAGGVLKIISSKLQLNLSLNEGSKEDIYFASQLIFKSIQNDTVCAFTVGGQNDWSFGGCHKSLDGCKETNIIFKYDINLWEQKADQPRSNMDYVWSHIRQITGPRVSGC